MRKQVINAVIEINILARRYRVTTEGDMFDLANAVEARLWAKRSQLVGQLARIEQQWVALHAATWIAAGCDVLTVKCGVLKAKPALMASPAAADNVVSFTVVHRTLEGSDAG